MNIVLDKITKIAISMAKDNNVDISDIVSTMSGWDLFDEVQRRMSLASLEKTF